MDFRRTMTETAVPLALAGRHALITGGTRGLGLGLARSLALAGARVSLVGRDVATGEAAVAMLAGEGLVVRAYVGDVADAGSIAAAVRAAEAAQGPIDILVCAAGVGAPHRPVWEATPEDYRGCFDINVLGVVNAMAAAMPGMIARRAGRVVAIGGTYGHKGVAGFSLYAASKWALRGLIRSAALDAAPHEVRVNIISPGGVEGERLTRMFRESAARNGEPEGAPLQRFLATTTLGRLVGPDDVAAALLHLVGPGGRMITGQDILVDAGTVI